MFPLMLLAASSLAKGVTDILGGRAANKAARSNADQLRLQYGAEADQMRLDYNQTLGTARNLVGAEGVTLTGSPLQYIAQAARNAEANIATTQRIGRLRVQNELQQGRAAQTGSYFAAGGDLLGGLNAIGRYQGWMNG